MAKWAVYFSSSSRNRSQRSHTHTIAFGLAGYLVHIDLYNNFKGASSKIGILFSTDKLTYFSEFNDIFSYFSPTREWFKEELMQADC